MAVVTKEGRAGRTAKIVLIAVAVFVIIFAFIWEAHLGRREYVDPDIVSSEGYGSTEPLSELSISQRRLTELDWVTVKLLPINAASRPGDKLSEINGVVIHYVGNPNTTAAQNRSYFAGLREGVDAYKSSNFIVGLDGEILQCVPIDEIAYCSNDRNSDTISIENCHPDATGEFNELTYASTVRLTAWLLNEFDLTERDILRHYDITGKVCPKYYVENEEAWDRFLLDVKESRLEFEEGED